MGNAEDELSSGCSMAATVEREMARSSQPGSFFPSRVMKVLSSPSPPLQVPHGLHNLVLYMQWAEAASHARCPYGTAGYISSRCVSAHGTCLQKR